MQKSYCYTPGVGLRVGVSVRVGVHKMLGQMLKSWNFSLYVFFSCTLSLLIILIKPLSTKTYDRCASGDCGTSGLHKNYHPSLYQIQETACSYESKVYYIHFLRISWEWNRGSYTKVPSFFVLWCDMQLVFWNLKIFNFLWRKKSAYYTPIGVLYPVRGIYPNRYLSPACEWSAPSTARQLSIGRCLGSDSFVNKRFTKMKCCINRIGRLYGTNPKHAKWRPSQSFVWLDHSYMSSRPLLEGNSLFLTLPLS